MEASPQGVERSLRIRLTALFLAVSLIATLIGTMAPVATSEAEETYGEFEEALKHISTTPYIFGNNFMHCLIMFAPAAGPAYGLFIMYATGVTLKMFAVAKGADVFTAFLGIFLFPFAWMEYAAYALAMSQSVWLLRNLLKRRARQELVRTCVWITVCAIILLSAAVMEAWLLAQWK